MKSFAISTSALLYFILPDQALADYNRGESEYRLKNFASAIYEWRQSAEEGEVRSQLRLAQMYERGQGVPRQFDLAKKWYSLAAHGGNVEAQRYVAKIYLQGLDGQKPDPWQAARWLQRAVDSGDAESAFLLGHLYYAGAGVARDLPKAISYYRFAAQNRVAAAQNNLGSLYESGNGLDKNDTLAAQWYLRAARARDSYGQNNMGRMYALGKGVPQDYAWAIFWFAMSASQGNIEAQKNIETYLAHLPRQQVTTETANIRLGNSTAYKVIAQVMRGQALPVLGEGQGWTQVYLESSQQLGWVSSSLLD